MKHSHERLYISFLVAAVCVAAVVMLRPEDPANGGMNERWFRFAKLQWYHVADVVFAGDSRVMCDISPAIIKESLSAGRVYNFGFPYNAFSKTYLSRVNSIIDPQSKSPVVVFGISPQAFTRHAAKLQGGTFVRKRITSPALMSMAWLYFEIDRRFDTLAKLHHKQDYLFYADYQPDGWLASDRLPPKNDAVIRRYREVFMKNKVDPNMLAGFMETVRAWSSRGITVYAFRPPTCSELRLIENEMSGFDEMKFVENFTRAGGLWIPIKPSDYNTYDGHHLSRESAIHFSKDFAAAVASINKTQTKFAELSAK